MITVTTAAKNALLTYARSKESQTIHLSIRVAGCTGFKYQMNMVDAPPSDGYAISLDERIQLVTSILDSYLIEGTVIDFVKEGVNSRFVYHNPNAKAVCGCGESFNA
jgi:Fe-S cluster assembly protein SufA